MDQTFRIEPRRIEFTTYGPARAPVWIVTFALHTASGYEHQCTVIVPGLGHDDVTDIHTKARAELFRLGGMIAGSANPVDEADTHAPHTSTPPKSRRRARQ